MKLRRRHGTACTWLIAAAVLLRSFIAPGYMLAVTGGDLRMVFCYGPAGAAQAVQDAGADHHHHSQSGGDQTEPALYVSPSCSFWSTSSLLVTAAQPALPQFAPGTYHEPSFHDPVLPGRVFDDARTIRGPPHLA